MYSEKQVSAFDKFQVNIYNCSICIHVFQLRKLCPLQGYKIFPVFSSRSFILPDFKYRSVSHLELTFRVCHEAGIKFHISPYGYPVASAPLVERLFLLSTSNTGTSIKNQLTTQAWSISRLYSVPLIYMSIFTVIPHCLDFSSFIVNLEIRQFMSFLCYFYI